MKSTVSRRWLLRVLATSGAALGTGGAAADPVFLSAEWTERELRNYAKTREAPVEQATDPAFFEAWQRHSAANAATYVDRQAVEPGWKAHANACATWSEQCTGDPRLYPGTDPFYGTEGERRRVAFHDRQGARLSGHLWVPTECRPNETLPGVVLTSGSVQAPETAYRWFARALVRAGYVVLTYDPRGQGRSDSFTPDGVPGSNAEPSVFVTNQVDAVDFLHSTPETPYRPNVGRLDTPGPVEPYNPVHDLLDRSRLGLVGHSAGAIGASVVQGLDPWPGALASNPVGAVSAWDNLSTVEQTDPYEGAGLVDLLGGEIAPDRTVDPRVPAMGQSADYFLTPAPKAEPPDTETKLRGFADWRAAGVPTYGLVVRGGTHYEWSRLPTFPATSWSFGNALAAHYSTAWLDRWLKRPDETGYHTADDRLLEDDAWADHLSFHYRSARAFPTRTGGWRREDDVRSATLDTDPATLTGGG
jgi:cephalosporin-C deacetylase-like acetyl esterase